MIINPNPEQEKVREIYPDELDYAKRDENKSNKDKRRTPQMKRIRPIILMLALILLIVVNIEAKIEGELSLGMNYTDNVFQLSDYDFARFKAEHPNLDYVKTTDDLKLSTTVDIAYPIHYKWWKFTPSVSGTLSQNMSNTDKRRMDSTLRLKVDRYYWSVHTLYSYHPYVYYRHYVDSDGSGRLEKYSYAYDLYRAELQVRPVEDLLIFGNIRYEDQYYNEHFQEADGNALTTELGARYSFPTFSLKAAYAYKEFDNTGYKKLSAANGSYESDIYRFSLRGKQMPLKGESIKQQSWQPYLDLRFENRFYQADDAWNGGRTYDILKVNSGFDIKLAPNWKLSLDYSHGFRNVDSPNESVVRLKEYIENSFSAFVKHKF
ncbi:MAG: hypothetical protein PHC50_03255 [Candidatus Cloacimonetes bacterium]|nr:hypothetical protein [Candidatus Cloacimonadota bacterium]